MMKCLSDKYIKTSSNTHITSKAKRKEKHPRKKSGLKQDSKQELSQGRITESPYRKQKCVESDSDDIDIQVPSETSE